MEVQSVPESSEKESKDRYRATILHGNGQNTSIPSSESLPFEPNNGAVEKNKFTEPQM